MQNDLIQRLPDKAEVAREIIATARKARRLRSLYKLVQKVETDRKELAEQPTEESGVACG